jgi:hypothetical protein
MAGSHNEAKFKAHILSLSRSADWDDARAEWELQFVYDDANDRACVCEHSPIQQICVIRNRDNHNQAEVGNVCVKRFMRIMSQRAFSCIKRITADPAKSLNPFSLDLFRRRGVITAIEEADYLDYWRKRTSLTPIQIAQKHAINARVLSYIAQEASRLIALAKAHDIHPNAGARIP